MGFQLDNIKTTQKRTAKSEDRINDLLKKEITLFGKSFSDRKKEDLYTELSVLLKAGVNLKEGLGLIMESQKKQQQKVLFANILEDIVAGQPFSESVKTKKEFTDYEHFSLKIGEETGTLVQVTKELGSFFARKNEQRRNLISALTYPIIIFSTALLVVAFMLRYVVPMFQDIFKQNNVDLPPITRFIVSLSETTSSYGWILLVGIIALLLLRQLFTKKVWYQRAVDNLIYKTPIIGKFAKTVYLAQFTQAVSLLTSSKVPVVNSIQLVQKMINFYPLRSALEKVERQILKGKKLSESLANDPVFDNKMVTLVRVAEETNQTEFIFQRLNEQYNTEVQQRSKMLSTIMEPMIILFVGIVVGVILIAMYLPMFQLSNVLG
ncbi:type II secretion system F family protein [Sungkyunkwania multivorans]|uniref:Type II secretion system F family protein n=1 Tax=Sungkyunkwania multivorans TaxID=1173618 RepID=A0ABW3D079_9FLAO